MLIIYFCLPQVRENEEKALLSPPSSQFFFEVWNLPNAQNAFGFPKGKGRLYNMSSATDTTVGRERHIRGRLKRLHSAVLIYDR